MARLRGRNELSSARKLSGSLSGGSLTSRASTTYDAVSARSPCPRSTRRTPSRRSPLRVATRSEAWLSGSTLASTRQYPSPPWPSSDSA